MLTETPKRVPTSDVSNRIWPTYYAGYSPEFVRDAINTLGLRRGARILDPWNGAGTTTSVSRARGIRSYGYDINPAVVLMARARLLGADVYPSVEPLAESIATRARKATVEVDTEPLERWFSPSGANVFRRLEATIRHDLIEKEAALIAASSSLVHVSSLAAYYYVSLFRTLRVFLKRFHGSNPTWVRSPADIRNRLHPSFDVVAEVFRREVTAGLLSEAMESALPTAPTTIFTRDVTMSPRKVTATIDLADSVHLPLDTESIDAVIGSPPYCTRIDYAVATWPELSLLGVTEPDFKTLREKTMGSCVSPATTPLRQADWGPTCRRLLSGIKKHPSHGSKTYYYRNHVAYFDRLHRSLAETWRVLKPTGSSVLVVQDSHYKELHTDLQQIVIEMMSGIGFDLKHRTDFHIPRTKAAVNTRSRRYRDTLHATESTLIFSCSRS
jgi:DNA modification methylase